MPPHWLPLPDVRFGLAVLSSSALVAAMFLASSGCSDQSRATTPTTCGPAIEVPPRLRYDVSLVLYEDRLLTPGAAMSGLMRPEPSIVTGPRLLKPAMRVEPVVRAPVEKAAE